MSRLQNRCVRVGCGSVSVVWAGPKRRKSVLYGIVESFRRPNIHTWGHIA